MNRTVSSKPGATAVPSRRFRVRLALSTFGAALLLALAEFLTPVGARAATLDMQRLYSDMGRYCMAQFCGGMSVKQIAAVPGATLVLDRPLLADRLCNSAQQQSINGSVIAADGTRYDVSFYMIPGAGAPEDVFRLVVVQLKLENLASEQLAALRNVLVNRYKLKGSGAPFPTAWFGSSPMLEISVAQQERPEADRLVSELRLIVAPVGAFAQTANRPWCLGEPVPPLPSPPRPLPVL